MTDSTRELSVSWDDIQRLSCALAWRLQETAKTNGKPWHSIVAVARGGMIPAVMIARELGIHIVDTVCISTYSDDHKKHNPQIFKLNSGDGTGCIVVDDLVDSGTTFETVRRFMPNAHYAAIYAKPQGRPHADSFMMEISQDTWITFPWEKKIA